MSSRMEKYHSSSIHSGTRSVRNENLYKNIYENVEYSNIEGIATMDKTNEISIDQIRELLKERENVKERKVSLKKEVPKTYSSSSTQRSYDIRDILVKAKDDHVQDNKNRSLKNIEFNILKKLDVEEGNSRIDKLEKTLANTSVLKNFDDGELSLDMLSDLKSTGNTIVDKTNAQILLNEVQEAKDRYQVKNDDGLDKSFYTSSLGFKDADFEQLKDIQDSIDSNNKLIKVLFFLIFVIVIGIVGFVIYKFI